MLFPVLVFRIQGHAENFPGTPEAHAWAPGARTTTDDDRHAIHFISSSKQGVDVLHQIAKGPDLPAVCVTGKHQACTSTRCLVGLPWCMREKDCCTRRPPRKCLGDGIASLARTVVGGKVFHACKD